MIISLNKIKSLLPKRTKLSSKIDGGKVLIIGGGKGLYGAGILSALAATRSGAGYTHLMSDLNVFPWVKFPDFILHPIKLSELKNKADFAIGIGPGLGQDKKKIKYIHYLINNNFQKVVVDADALSLISQFEIFPLPSTWILTPHEGELAKLLRTSSLKVKKNRQQSLIEAQKKYACTVILKGAETLISTPRTNKIFKIKAGTPALAKAGTGDILLGMIVALRAQGLTSLESAITGSFIHGKASALWCSRGQDYLSMRPMDLIDILPETLFKIRHQ